MLADFLNSTGDPVFDGTLRQGLAIQLEQSPFLSLIPEERLQQTSRPDGLSGQRAAHPGSGAGDLRANRECCGAGRHNQQPRQPVRVGGAGERSVGRGKVLAEEQVQARQERGCAERLGSSCQSIPGSAG